MSVRDEHLLLVPHLVSGVQTVDDVAAQPVHGGRDETVIGALLVTEPGSQLRADGPWELDDPSDENRFTMEAWGAQTELRAIPRQNRDATIKIRAAGRPKSKPSYGFQYVRKVVGGKADHMELHLHASEVLRDVARRILADPENVTTSSERPASTAQAKRLLRTTWPRCTESRPEGGRGPRRV